MLYMKGLARSRSPGAARARLLAERARKAKLSPSLLVNNARPLSICRFPPTPAAAPLRALCAATRPEPIVASFTAPFAVRRVHSRPTRRHYAESI